MSQKKSSIFLFFLFVNILNLISKNEIIIPTPNEISFRKGTFQIDEKTMILSNEKVILFKELYGQKKKTVHFTAYQFLLQSNIFQKTKKDHLDLQLLFFKRLNNSLS